jgi:hypothetical protein
MVVTLKRAKTKNRKAILVVLTTLAYVFAKSEFKFNALIDVNLSEITAPAV